MKILVTGAKGMMGIDLCRALTAQGHTVIATNIEDLDICNPDETARIISMVKPAMVWHLAALTDVDACERDPDSAFLTNTIGTQNVAFACRKNDAEMVYISTIRRKTCGVYRV
jgi:dTDP-4-dehydrorhamnose reductase